MATEPLDNVWEATPDVNVYVGVTPEASTHQRTPGAPQHAWGGRRFVTREHRPGHAVRRLEFDGELREE
jgi:hypothetical protein